MAKMKTMEFQAPVKALLRNQGEIYTVRKYRTDETEVYVSNVGQCIREFVKPINDKMELEEYAPSSGFPTLDNWYSKIGNDGGYEKMYLYRVRVKHPCRIKIQPARRG